MVMHTQTICRLELFEFLWPFCGPGKAFWQIPGP